MARQSMLVVNELGYEVRLLLLHHNITVICCYEDASATVKTILSWLTRKIIYLCTLQQNCVEVNACLYCSVTDLEASELTRSQDNMTRFCNELLFLMKLFNTDNVTVITDAKHISLLNCLALCWQNM